MQRKIFFQKCNFNYIFFVLYILVFFLNIYIGFDNYLEKFEIEQKKRGILFAFTNYASLHIKFIQFFSYNSLFDKEKNNKEKILKI